MNCNRIGIDIAKSVFQLHGVDGNDKKLLTKRLNRDQMIGYFAQIPPCEIAMEACGTSHYWGRKLKEMGHSVKLIAPQHVKPYVQGGKNDANDAAGICEAASRPRMKYVALKSEAQQAMQAVHRVRSVAVKSRTALVNEIRGLLAEFGIICVNKGVACARKMLMSTLHDDTRVLPHPMPEVLQLLADRLTTADEHIAQLDKMLQTHARQDEASLRLQEIEGIGIITASALVSSIDVSQFGNGRDFAAWLGLTPRQHSSGGKNVLGGITKRGDAYLRTLLIHGARTVLQHCLNKTDERSLWLQSLLLRRHKNVVAVALANKTARIVWAMLTRGEAYRVPRMIQVEPS